MTVESREGQQKAGRGGAGDPGGGEVLRGGGGAGEPGGGAASRWPAERATGGPLPPSRAPLRTPSLLARSAPPPPALHRRHLLAPSRPYVPSDRSLHASNLPSIPFLPTLRHSPWTSRRPRGLRSPRPSPSRPRASTPSPTSPCASSSAAAPSGAGGARAAIRRRRGPAGRARGPRRRSARCSTRSPVSSMDTPLHRLGVEMALIDAVANSIHIPLW
uniref:Uncharacterized protein n=1 Tax=Setaria viridis TaxID=4556 RepID=A0A4V6Y8H5_SETVI|nr:hypothetical protein SEVIR_4G077701v2 [Setaria viridis]